MTKINDAALAALVSLQTLPERLKEERGQVSAEYMGLVALAAFIIFALVDSDIPGAIAREVGELVEKISTGQKPS